MTKTLHIVFLFVSVAIFIRLLFFGFPDSSAPWFDEGIHLNLARTIVEERVFSLETAPHEFVNEKPLLITTNYPVLLPVAFSFALFGVGLAQAKIVMIVFLAVFALLAYRLARKLYGRTSALFALALLVTFLPLYGNGKSVLGEVPGLAFFLGGLLLLGRKKEWPTFLAGVLFGLAAATKSSFLIMLPAVVLGELFVMWQARKRDAGPGRSPTGKQVGANQGLATSIGVDRLLLLSIGASIPLLVWIWTLIPYEVTTGFLQNIVDLYRNPYNTEGTVLPNLKRFFTESTPIHYALLLVSALFAALRRGASRLAREEVTVLAFIALNLFFYLSTVGWYRYFFPSHVLLLVLFPGAVLYLVRSFLPSLHEEKAEGGAAFLFPGLIILGLVFIQAVVLVVNLRDPLYHNPVPREFGEAASELIGEREVVVVDNPEVAFFIQSENRRLYLKANPRFTFGEEPFVDGRYPQFIVAGEWRGHPYLAERFKEAEQYALILSGGQYHLYELSQ